MSSESNNSKLKLDSGSFGGTGPFVAFLAQGKRKTAIIILHGRNSNPDDGPIVGILRHSLAEAEYTTLSIANPVPDPDEFPKYVADVEGPNSLFREAYARIRAGIADVAARGAANVILLGFSMGARMHAGFLASGHLTLVPVRGLVALSAGNNGPGSLNTANSLPKVTVPVVDIYAEGDAMCNDTAADRKAAYQKGSGKSYTQVKIGNKAGHAFEGSEKEMEKAVQDWIKNLGQ